MGRCCSAACFATLQPNGAASPTARDRIARVNVDGTLDIGFDPKANSVVYSVAVQADGKVLLGGLFTALQPNGAASATARQYVARVHADGTLDTGFNPKANDIVYSVAVQTNGKALLGGLFTTLQPNGAAAASARDRIARVNADGTLDTGFDPKANSVVYSVAVQGDGKVLLGGAFFSLQPNGAASPTTRNFFARLQNAAATQTLSAPDSTQALWQRGGAAPELSRVTFELSTDGDANWTPLGAGTRVGTTANWQRIGLSLPATGSLRARGATTSGYTNGSAGLIEQVATFAVTTAPGNLDPLDANVAGLAGSFVAATAVQQDGKIIIGGFFSSVLGVPRSNIARLNADGTLDAGFNPKANFSVFGVAVQADGKVLLGGAFTTLQPNGAASPTARQYVARVNANGTLDTGFDPKAESTVWGVAVQADGKVLLGGNFTTLQPNGAISSTPRNRIARLHADGTLDTGFDPKADSIVNSVAVQADGKVLLGGQFTTLQPNGAASPTARQYIARVNANGTLDTGFDPKANNTVKSVVVQADGKVLLGGNFSTLQPNGAASATPRQSIARVNADGTLDTGFDPRANGVNSVAVQADGKVLLGGPFTALQPNGAPLPTTRNHIARVNVDGTLDTAFDPNADESVFSVAVQADGKVLLGGNFTALQPNGAASSSTRNLFARLYNDPATQTLSTPDSTQALWQRGGAAPELSRVTFELSTDNGANWIPLGVGTRVGTTANWQRTGLSLPASGSLRARGATSGGSNNSSSGLVEQIAQFSLPSANADLSNLQLSAGSLTPVFAPATTSYTANVNYSTTTLTVTPTTAAATATVKVNGITVASGSASAPINLSEGNNLISIVVTAADGAATKTYTVTVTRLAPVPGDRDPNFFGWANQRVLTAVVGPSQDIVVGGLFTSIRGVAKNYVADLRSNGSMYLDFDPNPNNAVRCVAILDDYYLLIGGDFTSVGGFSPGSQLVRIDDLSGSGAVGPPMSGGAVNCIALQPDGKAVIGGAFTNVSNTARNCIARLTGNTSLTLDTGFNPNANGPVHSIAMQPDGKMIIGGDFTSVGGISRYHLARLNSNGTVDESFNPSLSLVNCIVLQPDGRILVGGQGLTRLNIDGTTDLSFGGTASTIHSIALQTDGRVIAGGEYLTNNPARNIARFNSDGTVDATFSPSVNGPVFGITIQADGKILIGGDFAAVNGIGWDKLARLLNGSATQTLSVTSASRLEWLRGGTSPETHLVTFELFTSGPTAFTPLGPGARIGGGWELTGLSLPPSGLVRARARILGGYYDGSSGLVETVTEFGPDSDNDGLLNSWELTYWPSTVGHDADDDFDHDGLTELEELAFGLNPTIPDAAAIPAVVNEGGFLTATVSKHAGATYQVETAGTLLPGQPDSFSAATTTVLIDNATTLKVRDNFPVGIPASRYLRVKVTAAP